jgi:hypothetical protein
MVIGSDQVSDSPFLHFPWAAAELFEICSFSVIVSLVHGLSVASFLLLCIPFDCVHRQSQTLPAEDNRISVYCRFRPLIKSELVQHARSNVKFDPDKTHVTLAV